MDVAWYRCNLHYYLREKHFGKALQIAKNVSTSVLDSYEFVFYHGIANILQGQQHKGITDLTPLLSEKDIQLAVIIALVYAHKASNTPDKDALFNLELKHKEEKKNANATSLYYAGLFLSFAGKFEKSSDYINKALKKDPNYIDSIILKGWNDMYMSSGDLQISILDCLELALNKSNKNIEAKLGLAKFKYLVKDHDGSNLILDKLIVSNPGELVPLIEKLKNEFAMQKWDEVYDTIERINMYESDNIDAYKIKAFLTLCKNADYIETADQLNKFFNVLESNETYNGHLFLETSRLFSKVCSRSSTVLTQVFRFAHYNLELYPHNVDYMSEVGYQCLLQGKTKDATSFFKAASKIDSNSISALCGLTLCQMAESGSTEQTSQQVELLFEMQGNSKMPALYLLSAKLSEKNPAIAVRMLESAIDAKLSLANRSPYSLDYVKDLDPDFLLEVNKEYTRHLPKRPFFIIGYLNYVQEKDNDLFNNCLKMIETICYACPALITGVYELAKLKFLYGYAMEAHKHAQQIIEIDNTHAGSYILLALISIQQQDFKKAAQNLEMCLSYNFKVRDNPIYHFLNGVILKNENKLKEALSSYTTSLSIVSNKSHKDSKIFEEINIIDKATLYMEIIELQSSLGLLAEAGITMQGCQNTSESFEHSTSTNHTMDAIQELSYTSEEGRLVIVKSELALKKGDIDKAIDMLTEIKPGEPYYFQAHTKLAHIYLQHKNDKAMFTSCFKEVVSHHPMADAHSMMGDAFMSIHEPAQAMESYRQALKDNPYNPQLIKKLAHSLFKMHDYEKAMEVYENAIVNNKDEEIMTAYIEMLVKLKQHDKADSIITNELNQPHNKEKDINTLKRRVNLLCTQARIRDSKNPTASNTVLIISEAKDLQTTIVKRMEIDIRGDLGEEKRKLSEILCSLAKVKSVRESSIAAGLYAEALVNTPRDPSTLLALAKLYAQMNDPEKCEQTCSVLLNADPNNESAAVMMADLAFRKVDLETAQRHLNQILSVKPTSWEALAQLIEVQWRRGKLKEADEALEKAKAVVGETDDPGYWYCQGLLSSYNGKPNAALRALNRCRRTSPWGGIAASKMALLCVSGDANTVLGDGRNGDDGDTRLLALRTAEKLTAEVPATSRRSLAALVSTCSRQKAQAEKVLQDVLPLVTEQNYQDDPYLILAIANAYNIIKQPTRAKNILKRTISSIPWSPENADGLERCWLEIAENQISSGRHDAAKELLTKILNHNNSCAPAYQYLGFLAEKEQNYKQAVQHFDNAWTYTGKGNLSVGYKLAHGYLKLKKYPECIIVCRHVLKLQPDYPKIKKEIMEKAKQHLRT